jgi:hypothetical protein
LHLLLQDAERLIDVVVANEHLQIFSPSVGRTGSGDPKSEVVPAPPARVGRPRAELRRVEL